MCTHGSFSHFPSALFSRKKYHILVFSPDSFFLFLDRPSIAPCSVLSGTIESSLDAQCCYKFTALCFPAEYGNSTDKEMFFHVKYAYSRLHFIAYLLFQRAKEMRRVSERNSFVLRRVKEGMMLEWMK